MIGRLLFLKKMLTYKYFIKVQRAAYAVLLDVNTSAEHNTIFTTIEFPYKFK